MRILRKIILLLFLIAPTIIKAQNLDSKDQKEVYNTIVLIGIAWTQNNLDTLEKYIHKDYVHSQADTGYCFLPLQIPARCDENLS